MKRVHRTSLKPIAEALAGLSYAGLIVITGDDGNSIDLTDLLTDGHMRLTIGMSPAWVIG
jgi:hypothetical protein